MNWKRILIWSLLIFATANVIAFCFGLSMARWGVYGNTIETAATNVRLIRRVVIGAVTAFLYWRFARGVETRRSMHILLAFFAVQLLDAAISIALGAPVQDIFEPWSLLRSLLAPLIGLIAASVGSNNSSKPTPLRGAA